MIPVPVSDWQQLTVPPEAALKELRSGMNIFLGSGMAEPRTLVRRLLEGALTHLEDLRLIQLVSLGDAVSLSALRSNQFRLITFLSGWPAGDAITEGLVDLIPGRYPWIPDMIASGQVPVDAVFLQVSPPNSAGYCSLGLSVDAAIRAMERASLVVGEISPQVPFTFGDTFIPLSRFDFIVAAQDPPVTIERWPTDPICRQVAANVAALIEDESCLAFSIGPMFESLSSLLSGRRDLGIHSPFITDSLMDLIDSGAVTNRCKGTYRGKALVSYAIGTAALVRWLDHNPLVDFQRVDKVFDPVQIGRNPKFVAVLPIRKIDLAGRMALHVGKGNVANGPSEVLELFNGAELSAGGFAVFALASRNRAGKSNIRMSIDSYPNHFNLFESVDLVVTEYGVASLRGRSLRERAQALIDISHPEDRGRLVNLAKANKILYEDQIFLQESADRYPAWIDQTETFKDGLRVRFRAIRPADEEQMRRLFYRFSDQSVYARYFHTVRSMPHAKMQTYVNVDWNQVMSMVGTITRDKRTDIIAEGRYIRIPGTLWAEAVFVVDEAYQRKGLATFIYTLLVRLAKGQGIEGFVADVLFSNTGMMKVFRKGNLPLEATLAEGVYHLRIPFDRGSPSPDAADGPPASQPASERKVEYADPAFHEP